MSNNVGFIRLAEEKYKNLQNKNENALYFTTDTNNLYRGTSLVSSGYVGVLETPEDSCISLDDWNLFKNLTVAGMYKLKTPIMQIGEDPGSNKNCINPGPIFEMFIIPPDEGVPEDEKSAYLIANNCYIRMDSTHFEFETAISNYHITSTELPNYDETNQYNRVSYAQSDLSSPMALALMQDDNTSVYVDDKNSSNNQKQINVEQNKNDSTKLDLLPNIADSHERLITNYDGINFNTIVTQSDLRSWTVKELYPLINNKGGLEGYAESPIVKFELGTRTRQITAQSVTVYKGSISETFSSFGLTIPPHTKAMLVNNYSLSDPPKELDSSYSEFIPIIPGTLGPNISFGSGTVELHSVRLFISSTKDPVVIYKDYQQQPIKTVNVTPTAGEILNDSGLYHIHVINSETSNRASIQLLNGQYHIGASISTISIDVVDGTLISVNNFAGNTNVQIYILQPAYNNVLDYYNINKTTHTVENHYTFNNNTLKALNALSSLQLGANQLISSSGVDSSGVPIFKTITVGTGLKLENNVLSLA